MALIVHAGMHLFHVYQNGQYDLYVNLYLKFGYYSKQTTIFLFHLHNDKAVCDILIIHKEEKVVRSKKIMYTSATISCDSSVFY